MNLLELEGTLSNYIRRVLTNQYAHLFTNRVINNWNSLPSNIVLAGTLNSFKNLIIWHKVASENKPGQFTQHS